MAAVLRELVSLALVVGLIVTATAMLIILLGNGGAPRQRHRTRHRRRHDDPPPGSLHAAPPGPRPTPLGNTPASAVAAARARAHAAAEQLLPLDPNEMPAAGRSEPLALPPGSTAESARAAARTTSPAGQPAPEPDVPVRRLDPSTEELRSAIDRLIESNPDFLAEVITKWIRSDSGTEATGPPPPNGSRRTAAHRTDARPRRP